VDYPELQKRINQYVKLDLAPLFEAYKAQSGSESIEGFIEFLSNARVIDTSLRKELHTAGDVELPSVSDAALSGTKLATWVQDAVTIVSDREPAKAPLGASPTGGTDVRYTPIALLGQGAMGAIQIARDVYLRRKVALKTVLPAMAAYPQLLGRFLSEMQITAQLEHPNIVPIYALEVGPDGSLGYAMKLVKGRDLAQLIDETRKMVEQGKPLDEDHTFEKRLEYFLKVCDALDVAHAKGILHRDLKPANIMIGNHNEVYLMDWGIARPMGAGGQALEAGIELHQADGEQVTDLSRTRIGSAIGTPPYMSPEQAAGRNAELDSRSDQYAMGLILQECVSLRRAVWGTTLQEILTKAKEAKRDPIGVGEKHGHMPKEIEAIVNKATRLRPEDRYPSIRALADDVRRYLRNEAVGAARQRHSQGQPLGEQAPHGVAHDHALARARGVGGDHRHAPGRAVARRGHPRARAPRERAPDRVGDPGAARRPRARPLRVVARAVRRRRATRAEQALHGRDGALFRRALRAAGR